MSAESVGIRSEGAPDRLEDLLSIQSDGTVVARSGKVEYGQGIRTGFARIVAQELDMPLERVRIDLGETDTVPWDMGTFGSLSTATDGKRLRMAAAYACSLLLRRASERFHLPEGELRTGDGAIHAPDGRVLSYRALTAVEPLAGPIPQSADGKAHLSAAQNIPLRLEALAIVTGRARYPADVRLPGMLRGHVCHPPQPGATLLSLDDAEARALPGVVAVVREGDFVGAVAERDEQAAAAAALAVQWRGGAPSGTEALFDRLIRDDEGVEARLQTSSTRLDAHYHVPHIAHAPIGPGAAVADVGVEGAHLYVATQRPFGLRDEVAALLGLSTGRVHVHPQAMGGMYGRGNMNDVPLEAVRLSRAVQRPVLVQWTRTEEFRLSPHRPLVDATLAAALERSGTISAWYYHERTNLHTYGSRGLSPDIVEMTCGRNAVPPYRLGQMAVRLEVVPARVRTGAFRSLAAAPNVFAIESFMDELAHASAQDPVAFRLRHIDNPRLKRVLETVSQRSGWSTRQREPRRGMGVACALYNGTYVAEVVEASVEPTGRIIVERVWCAVDAGHLVHPDGARNQIEGGIQQAASWTLLERLGYEGSTITTSSWRDYPIATALDAPHSIEVVFTGDNDAPSTGVGEPGSVPTAAAIANAVYDACAIRCRRLPLDVRQS